MHKKKSALQRKDNAVFNQRYNISAVFSAMPTNETFIIFLKYTDYYPDRFF